MTSISKTNHSVASSPTLQNTDNISLPSSIDVQQHIQKPISFLPSAVNQLLAPFFGLSQGLNQSWVDGARAQALIHEHPVLKEVLGNQSVLKEGMGPSQVVRMLQGLLQKEGSLTLDESEKSQGIFGPTTKAAVEQFQKTHDLKIDGKVGPSTLATLLNLPIPSVSKQNPVSKSENLARQEFIQRYAEYALETQKQTGIPASVTLAQGILESQSGKSAPGNNFFGIKGTGPAGTQLLPTWEEVDGKKIKVMANFRKYNNPLECFLDHAKVISQGKYLKHAMKHTHSGPEFIRALQSKNIKYASDRDYVEKILSIMKDYNLERFDKMKVETQVI